MTTAQIAVGTLRLQHSQKPFVLRFGVCCFHIKFNQQYKLGNCGKRPKSNKACISISHKLLHNYFHYNKWNLLKELYCGLYIFTTPSNQHLYPAIVLSVLCATMYISDCMLAVCRYFVPPCTSMIDSVLVCYIYNNNKTNTSIYRANNVLLISVLSNICLQCFDAVGWAARRAIVL